MRYHYGPRMTLLWVAPGAVSFSKPEIKLLLPELYKMREGIYPTEPNKTNPDIAGSHTNTRANFEPACQVAAEIDRRLARCGQDRTLVEDSYCSGDDDEAIAIYYHMDVREVRRRIKDVVNYISSGDCPRWLGCDECGQHDACHKEKKDARPPITYSDWRGHRSVGW